MSPPSGSRSMAVASMVVALLVAAGVAGPSAAAAAQTAGPPPPAAPPALPASSGAPDPTVAHAASTAPARGAAFAVQGGWWSVEAEWRTRFGVYGAAGVPWMMVPLSLVNGATWVVPVAGRLGYDVALSPRWSLRASAHAATMVANEKSKCGCADDHSWRTFLFAEVGVRYQSPSGLVAGAELPLVGLRTPHHDFPPPLSLAFTQLYLGYSWGR